MRNLTIENIARVTGGQIFAREQSGNAMECQGVVIDSRLVLKDFAFIAVKGEKVDGHTFIKQVFEKGALLVICEDIPEDYESNSVYGTLIKVDNCLAALKKIAAYYREQLSIKVVGVTGSVGKTSTKEFLASVLSEKFNVFKTQGNLNNQIGVPLTLLSIRDEHEVAVVEMGINQFGEMSRLTAMAKPDIAVITNIGECHLEFLEDRDGVLRAKSEIFEGLAENGSVVLNGDDDKLITINKVNNKKPITFGIDNLEADYIATSIVFNVLEGTVCNISTAMEDGIVANIKIPGRHMIYNAMAATAVARLLGMTYEQIADGIKNTKSVGGRTNIIKTEQYTIIDDCYNANPTSVKAAIDLLSSAGRQGKTAILGDMFELGETETLLHREVGLYAGKSNLDRIICVGKLSKNMYDGALETAQNCSVFYFETLEETMQKLNSIIKEGDCVLVKASHGMNFAEIVQFLGSAK